MDPSLFPDDIWLLIFELIDPNLDELLNLIHVNQRLRSILLRTKHIRELQIPSYWPAKATAAFLTLPDLAQAVQKVVVKSPLSSAFGWDETLENTEDPSMAFVSFLPPDFVLPSLKSLDLIIQLSPNECRKTLSVFPNLTDLTLHQSLDDSTWETLKSLLESHSKLRLHLTQASTSVLNKFVSESPVPFTFPLVLSPRPQNERAFNSGVTFEKLDDHMWPQRKFSDTLTKLVLRNVSCEFETLRNYLTACPQLKHLVLDGFIFWDRKYTEQETNLELLLASLKSLESFELRATRWRPVTSDTDCPLTDVFSAATFQRAVNDANISDATVKRSIGLKAVKLVGCPGESVKEGLELINSTGTVKTLQLQNCKTSQSLLQTIPDFHASMWKSLRHFIYQETSDYSNTELFKAIMRLLLDLSVPLRTLVLPRAGGSLGPIPTLTTLHLDFLIREHEDWVTPLMRLPQLYPKLEALVIGVSPTLPHWEAFLALCRDLEALHTVVTSAPSSNAEAIDVARRVHGRWLGPCYVDGKRLIVTFCPVKSRTREDE